MSFRVLVIPEDPMNNGYILKPLIEAVVADAGKPRAKVEVLTSPRLRGYDHALRAIKQDLPDRYGFFELWIFVPDADRATPTAMAALEAELGQRNITLLCCPARPEVEIYACAAYRSEIPGGWEVARRAERLKEEVFEPLLRRHGDPRRPGSGRDLMIAESLKNLPALFGRCPELQELRNRIAQVLES